MHESSNGVPHDQPRLSGPRAARLPRALALAAASLCAFAGAQGADQPPGATVVGAHYQDLLPTDDQTVQVFLPRPRQATWQDVMLSSSDPCLELGELGNPGPEYVLVLDVRLAGGAEGQGESAPGTTCSAAIVAEYRSGDTTWEGTTLVAIHRLEHPPVPDGVVEAALTLDRIGLPLEPGTRPMTSLVSLALTNVGAEPIVLLGLADQAALSATVGAVYQYDEPLPATLADLEATGRKLTATTLTPGDTTTIALVLDPGSRLPDGSAVLTVQPALLLDVAGATYSLRFERLSTTWGNELP